MDRGRDGAYGHWSVVVYFGMAQPEGVSNWMSGVPVWTACANRLTHGKASVDMCSNTFLMHRKMSGCALVCKEFHKLSKATA